MESCFAQLSPAAVIVSEGHATAAREAAHSLGLPLITLCPSLSEDAGRFRLHAPSRGEVAPDLEPEPDNLALFMQTSGTVGGPKLVMHSHQTILSAAASLVESFHLSEGDRAISIAPMFHSLALVGTVLTAAISGSSLICAADSSPQMFFEGMDEFSPTWFGAVPSMLQAILLDAPRFEHVIRRRQLRFFRSVAAPLPAASATALEGIFRAPLIQVYGMSEAPGITAEPLPPGERRSGSVGRVICADVAIVNDDLERVPAGAYGQVAVRGGNVALGYWNNPHATGEAFRNGWLLTGDCGHFDEDGFLYLTGRIREFINRGGEKICPAEVDEVLQRHPRVAQALTFPIPDSRLGEEVAVALVAGEPGAVTAVEMQRFAAARLAFHKIPRHFFFLDEIPVGDTGKPSRQGMRDRLPLLTPPPPPAHAAPRNALEKTLARLWAEAIRRPEPGIHDPFFESGGESLVLLGHKLM